MRVKLKKKERGGGGAASKPAKAPMPPPTPPPEKKARKAKVKKKMTALQKLEAMTREPKPKTTAKRKPAKPVKKAAGGGTAKGKPKLTAAERMKLIAGGGNKAATAKVERKKRPKTPSPSPPSSPEEAPKAKKKRKKKAKGGKTALSMGGKKPSRAAAARVLLEVAAEAAEKDGSAARIAAVEAERQRERDAAEAAAEREREAARETERAATAVAEEAAAALARTLRSRAPATPRAPLGHLDSSIMEEEEDDDDEDSPSPRSLSPPPSPLTPRARPERALRAFSAGGTPYNVNNPDTSSTKSSDEDEDEACVAAPPPVAARLSSRRPSDADFVAATHESDALIARAAAALETKKDAELAETVRRASTAALGFMRAAAARKEGYVQKRSTGGDAAFTAAATRRASAIDALAARFVADTAEGGALEAKASEEAMGEWVRRTSMARDAAEGAAARARVAAAATAHNDLIERQAAALAARGAPVLECIDSASDSDSDDAG